MSRLRARLRVPPNPTMPDPGGNDLFHPIRQPMQRPTDLEHIAHVQCRCMERGHTVARHGPGEVRGADPPAETVGGAGGGWRGVDAVDWIGPPGQRGRLGAVAHG